MTPEEQPIARYFHAFNRHYLNTVKNGLGIPLARFLDRFRDAKKAIHRCNLCPLIEDPRSWRQAGDGELSRPLQVEALLVIALGLERVSSLPGNVCLTCSDGLLLDSRVASQAAPEKTTLRCV